MALLKEDGSLDIERINQLPIEEYMEMIGSFTNKEREEYYKNCPFYESTEPVKPIVVDYDLDDKRSGIDADVLLDRLRKRLKCRK